MKKIFLILILYITHHQATECVSIENKAGYSCKTISKTYKNYDEVLSMWFECSTVENNNTIETSMTKIDVIPDKKLKMGQSVDYDENGNVKSQKNNSDHGFVDVAPGTIGEWMWEIMNGWEYIVDKKITEDECNIVLAIGDIKSRYPYFDITKVHSYLKELYKISPEQAEKSNDPKGWERIWKEKYLQK